MLYRVEGIVIRSMDYGEGNKIITLLTPDYGKQGVLVRGAKKLKSRYGALAKLFTHGEYAYFKTSSLGTLNSGEVIEPFRQISEGLELPAYAAYAAELTDKAIGDEESAAFLYHQFKACLTALADGKDPHIVLRVYEMKIIGAAGYSPVLDTCACCGRSEGPFKFSYSSGGAICPQCRHRDPAAAELADPIWKLMRLFQAMDMRRLGSITVRDAIKQQLKQVIHKWMDAHLGLQLKSQRVMEQIEQLLRMSPEAPKGKTESGNV